jgi:hypothetical protein
MGKNIGKPPLSVVSTLRPAGPTTGLGKHGRALWDLVTSQYEISDAAGITMLRQIAFAADRLAELKAAIDRDGATVLTRSGPKVHPALKAELELRSFITRTLARLGLDCEPLRPGPGRPGGGVGILGENLEDE